ncbi:t-SNARE [Hyaloscypha variabilis F]|uniref:t-SNARE n=1 Tax=Hyaloscypha variabilis (strain UAMH 11265 / GT02V1 / F) TaxID=1149755 RepID=A0A2J6QZ79_HYAVF|nr:t-SNARE [Hyaloscypha variabilis F]
MSYGYGGRPNPFDQREDAATSYNQPSYNAPAQYGRQQPSYNAPLLGRDDYNGQNVEMAPLAQNGSQFGRQADPNQILNACKEINEGINDIKSLLERIQMAQGAALNDPSGRNNEVEKIATQILAMYHDLIDRVKIIKRMPESGTPRNASQVGFVERMLRETHNDYMKIDSQFRQRSNEQSARQYRIVRPDASELEVRQAVENPDNQQVFQQAMMNSNRSGQVQSTMDAVRLRHEAIQNIERQMIELAGLFDDMNNLVMEQEAAVTNIEMKGEEVVEHMDKGNQEIGTAIVHARNTRKWKWWCLCITVLIIVIIAAGVAGWYFTLGPGAHKNTKRFVITDLPSHRVLSGNPWSPPSTAAKPVVPGVDWTPSVKRAVRSFIA